MHGITFGRGLFETTAGRVDPDSDVHFGLLLIAAASEREGASREEICTLLWPDVSPEQARHSLRQALYRLRRLAVPIYQRGTRVTLNGQDTHVDLRRLFEGSAQREELLAIGTLPFLPGYTPKLGPRFAAWLEALRDRANSVRRFALVEAIRDARAQARFRDIHKLARALLTLDPLNETATLRLAEALVMDGSKVEALRMLDAYEEEVGLISDALRIPVRTLRRRVSEGLDDALLPRRYEVPFVGREAEFTELRTMFVATRQGKGQCAVVTGEAGIGKTRITSELLRLAVLDGAMAVTYSCTSGDALSPLSSLLTLTQALLAQPGALGCSQEHLQYLRRLNAPESSPPIAVSGMGADIAYAQLVYALSELVAAIADEGPLVVFVDDAQRLHQTSWRIFTDLVDRLPDRRVLLVFATRQLPEWYASLGITGSDGRSRHVRLKPLPYAESRSYLSAWSEKHGFTLSERDTHAFSLTADGNPFYLGELAGHVGRGGDANEAPASIRGLIQLQHAATSKKAQRVLLVISLLQARASISRVTDVLNLPSNEFVPALEELEIEGLVTASGSMLRAKHDLVAEVTIGLSTPGVLSFIRTRVATILEQEAEETDSVELLSDSLNHWTTLGEEQHVFATALRVASRLLAAGFASDAVAAFELAWRSSRSSSDAIAAIDGLVRASWISGDTFETLKRLQDRDQVIGDPKRDTNAREFGLIRAEAAVTRTLAPESSELAGLRLSADDSPEIAARKLMLAAIAADLAYDFDELKELLLRARAHATRHVTSPDLLTARLITEASIGDIDSTLQLSVSLADFARRSGDPRMLLLGLRRSATALAKIGFHDEAVVLAGEAFERATHLRLPHQQGACLELMAYSHLDASRRDEALNILGILDALARKSTSEMLLLVLRGLSLRVACEFGNREDSAELLQWIRSNRHYFTTAYANHTMRTVEAKLASTVGEPPSGNDIAELVRLHRLVRATGRQDFRTMMLAQLLVEVGQAGEAKAIVDEYLLLFRREGAKSLTYVLSNLPSALRDERN